MIAILFALPSESSAFLRLLQNSTRNPAGSHVISGTLHGRAVSVLHTGVGEETTRARLANLLRAQTPQLFISSGFAGALSDEWRVGDLLHAQNFSTAPIAFAAQLGYRTGTLATVPAMIDSPAERQALARGGADAVDMETAHIAAVCATANIPLISLRAISDTPAAPFPAPPHVLFNVERQGTSFMPLFVHLLLHPTAIGRFISFARQIAHARQSLTQALDALVRSAPLQR